MKLSILVCALMLLAACRGDKNKYEFSSKKEKYFYTNHRGYDYIRFPLIMPYEVMCINFEEMNWKVRLEKGEDFYFSINQLKSVAVINSVIVVYSNSNHQVEVSKDPKKWFVIVPSKQIEMGFTTEEEFKSYLKSYGIGKIEWIDVNQAFKQFEDTECLPWIKGCSQ